MNNRRRFKLSAGVGLVTMLLGALMVLAPGAGAVDVTPTPPEGGVHKIDICHRTNSISNPYVLVSVDIDGGDGSIGKGPDHYEHDIDGGGIFDFDATDLDETYPKPRKGDQWGDIIPPVALFNDDGDFVGMSDGLNWAAGQEILENGCAPEAGPNAPVVIVKKTVPGDPVEEDFNFSINGGTPFSVAANSTSDDFEVAPSNSVTVAEDLTRPAGYDLTDVTCTLVSSEEPDGLDLDVSEANGAVSFPINNDEVVTCEFTNTPSQTSTASVSIVKTNNADGVGDYHKTEQASPGADVPFRLVITNTGDVDVNVTSLKDSYGAIVDQDLLSLVTCTVPGTPAATPFDLDDPLTPGTVVTCDFVLEGYAPASFDGSLTNTVELDTSETGPVTDTSTVTTPGQIIIDNSTYSIDIDKRNDANGNGRFTDMETAVDEGDAVEFQVTIRNTGTGPLTLQGLTDTFDGRTVNLLDPTAGLRCPGAGNALLVGTVLPAGATRVCTFELDDYAPAAGDSLVNTVAVDTDRADDMDTSEVETAETQVLPDEETPPVMAPPVSNPPVDTPPSVKPETPKPEVKGVQTVRALPRTGDETRGLAGMGALMLAVGAAMVLGSKRKLAADR